MTKSLSFKCSLELGNSIDVALEGTVVNIGSVVVKVGHDWLVHGTIPLDVAWLSHAVSVHILVVLMVNWSLASSPLSVRIGDRRVLGENAGNSPVEEIWIVDESLGVESVIVEDKWAIVSETTADTSEDEVANPTVS